MKTFLTILIVLAVAGYNIWAFFENKNIDEYNDALDNYNKALYEKSLPVAQRLCEEKNIPIQEYPLQMYEVCGIIKTLSDV